MYPKLLTVSEVARILDVTDERVRQMARADILPVVHLGRQIRINADTLQQWIANGGKQFSGGWRKQPVEA